MLLGQHDDLNFANLGTCGHFIYLCNDYLRFNVFDFYKNHECS